MPHEIRLAGPWEICRADDVWERCALPFPAEGVEQQADASLRRKFHRPSGLSEQSRVAIVIVVSDGILAAELNGLPVETTVGTDSTVLLDITQQLREFNTVELKVPASTTVTEARLRIVEPDEG